MPVILKEDQIEDWLNCEKNSFSDVTKNILSKWGFVDEMKVEKLGPNVSNIREKSAKCLMTLEEHKEHLKKNWYIKVFYI
mmetsp:Transcript_17877/g.2486  ORF Transcript_17877/g.2486 Transcript_17877/m.2486 type:complete len:80 (+) Transcript_17877:112-351(+)